MTERFTEALSLKAAYEFGERKGLVQEVREIREMVIEWDLTYTSSLRRGYIVALFEKAGVFEDFKREHWPFGNTAVGERKRNQYLSIKSRYEAFIAGGDSGMDDEAEDEDAAESDKAVTFALEAHLRDFLAKNLDRVEPGLRLYTSAERTGIEFPVESGRIDLLAVDKTGKYVVIELKLARGRDRALGQILYYMGWIDQNLGGGPCRGLIIASDITDELTIAVSRVPGVGLARYRMSFAIEAVSGKDPSDTKNQSC